jgi:hypothetical protein
MKDPKPGNIYHIVRSGDNIESIAFEYGHFGETIWEHPNNAELKKLRRDPDVLAVGDKVFVPLLREKIVKRETNQVHRFQCKNTPSLFRFRPLMFGAPLKGEKYVLTIDEEPPVEGVIDENGTITHQIKPDAVKAKVTVGEGLMEMNYELELRALAPIRTTLGIQGRLRQLGIYEGALDGRNNSETQNALAVFQEIHGLEPTGESDEETIKMLLEKYER